MRIENFLSASPIFNLSVAYDEILGSFQSLLAAEEVHFLQALILTGIFFEDRPVRPTELAQALVATKSNMSHALRDLEKRGLVDRSTSPTDARAYFFALTRAGRKKVPRLIKLFDSHQNQIEQSFAGKRITPSLKLFRAIYRGLI